jgi:hypothetical protein
VTPAAHARAWQDSAVDEVGAVAIRRFAVGANGDAPLERTIALP